MSSTKHKQLLAELAEFNDELQAITERINEVTLELTRTAEPKPGSIEVGDRMRCTINDEYYNRKGTVMGQTKSKKYWRVKLDRKGKELYGRTINKMPHNLEVIKSANGKI